MHTQERGKTVGALLPVGQFKVGRLCVASQISQGCEVCVLHVYGDHMCVGSVILRGVRFVFIACVLIISALE